MKKIIFVLIFMGLLITGCQNTENLVNPIHDKTSTNITQPLALESGFLGLPSMKQTGSNVMDDLTDAALISGKRGGELEVEGNLGIATSGKVEVHGTLDIPRNSFSGLKVISMSVDKGSTSVTFGPSGTSFSKSLILDLEYEGLMLNGIDLSTITFAYLGSDGNIYPVKYKSIDADVEDGKLTVRGAEIDHFSRFGFVR
ncbi:MAG: hypothetical protein WCZ90_10655 [Melioribacteraceae bacterium]